MQLFGQVTIGDVDIFVDAFLARLTRAGAIATRVIAEHGEACVVVDVQNGKIIGKVFSISVEKSRVYLASALGR
jgi:hypothetical protein